MPSPFPGMDPWLEAPGVFPSVHNTLVVYLGEAVNALLPEPYFARTGTRVYAADDDPHREPDVSLVAPGGHRPAGPAAAFDAPGLLLIERESDPSEEWYLDIRSADGERLVTSVEVLSRANKRGGKGRKQYLAKQAGCLSTGVGLVEIDLLRAGRHTTAVPADRLRDEAEGAAYHACISGRAVGRRLAVAPIRLADRLPPLPVPLDPGVPPVVVDLQPLMDRCYDTGLYRRQIDYARPPRPRLTPEQQAWADEILRSKGLKP